MTSSTIDHLLDTGSDAGRDRVNHLEDLFDEPTVACLETIRPRPGDRCLDLGGGGGSVARWMAERTGPRGSVVAVDLETDQLRGLPGVEVHRHDVNHGLPVDGPFDLVHARLLLARLPRREEILELLVDSLAPGGWLVLGEASPRRPQVLAAPGSGDAELFNHIQHLLMDRVSPASGFSWAWARQVDQRMTAAGLTNVGGLQHRETAVGGGNACLLWRNVCRQAQPALLDAGASVEQLDRFDRMMLDPRLRCWFHEFVCTRGQRPAC